jgi:chromosome partitioning protein
MADSHRNTRIVAIGNQKGGVTKTSTVVNLAAALAERGRLVLVWDLDVNCGSTRLLGIPNGINVYGTYEVMVGEESAEEVIITPGELEQARLPNNVHLIPAHPKLEQVESALAAKNGPFWSIHGALKKPMQSLVGKYDYILLDTSPSMTPPTRAAYLAARYFVLAAIPEKLAMEGLVNAINYIQFARESGNPDLKLMGIVMNQVPGKMTRLARAILAEIDQVFATGDEYMQRFKTEIHSSTVVPTLQQSGKYLFEAEPDHKVTHQFRALAAEFEARFDKFENVPASPIVEVKPALVTEAANG